MSLPPNVHLNMLDNDDQNCMLDDDEDETEEAAIKKITSAGVLPFAVFKKRVYFLLGKESFEPNFGDTWSDFSGKIEENESVEQGAAREAYEETAGCLMLLEQLRAKLEAGEYLLHSDLHPKKSSSFRTYLMLVPYKDYPLMFRRTKAFVQYPQVHGDVSIIEKSQIQWFPYEEFCEAIFDRWDNGRYRRKPQLRARFAENMRRIMRQINLREHCLHAYASESSKCRLFT